MKQIIIAVILAGSTLFFQYRYGCLSGAVFRANALSVFVPYICITVCFLIYHIIHAAVVLHHEINSGALLLVPGRIILADGSDGSGYTNRGIIITHFLATILCLLLIGLCWVLFRIAPPVVQQVQPPPISKELPKTPPVSTPEPLKPEPINPSVKIPSIQPPPIGMPNVSIRFVYPKSPALMFVNPSDLVARDIKWAVVLWNMDLPDRNDPLPIPSSSVDWIKPHDEVGPTSLFGTPIIAPLLSAGNRLFGSAMVDCATCARGRTYIVYIVLGEGGWFSEINKNHPGKLLVPHNFSKETREAYFGLLDSLVPRSARIPIGSLPLTTEPPNPVQEPRKTQTPSVPQQKVIDPAVQLLERAEDAVRSCHSFQDSSMKRTQEAQVRIQRHNSLPGQTEQSKSQFAQWQTGIVYRDDMQQYSQIYMQEFMEVRRLLVLKGIDETVPGTDFENPGNMGGVTGICFDLSELTKAYINRQYVEGKISLEEGRRYLDLLVPNPQGTQSQNKASVPTLQKPATAPSISVESINQQGGITAGIVNVNPRPKPLLLSDGQQESIRKAIAPFAGNKIKVINNNPTEETQAFAVRFESALRLAGIIVEAERAAMYVPPSNCINHPGVWFIVGANRMNEANSLAVVLGSSGVVEGQVPGCTTEKRDDLTIVIARP